jgi:hypothetical protein
MKAGATGMVSKQDKAVDTVGQVKVNSKKEARMLFEPPADGFLPWNVYQQYIGKTVDFKSSHSGLFGF